MKTTISFIKYNMNSSIILVRQDEPPLLLELFNYGAVFKIIAYTVLYLSLLKLVRRRLRAEYILLALTIYGLYILTSRNYAHLHNAAEIYSLAHGNNITMTNHIEKIDNNRSAYNQYIVTALKYNGNIYRVRNTTRLNVSKLIRTGAPFKELFMPWNPLGELPISHENYFILMLVSVIILNLAAIFAIIVYKL